MGGSLPPVRTICCSKFEPFPQFWGLIFFHDQTAGSRSLSRKEIAGKLNEEQFM